MAYVDKRRISEQVRSLTKRREEEFIFVLKIAFLKDGGDWINCFSLLQLMKKAAEKLRSDKLDYTDFVLEKRVLSLDEGLTFLQRLDKGELYVDGYNPMPYVTSYDQPKFLGSGSTHWYLRVEQPTRLYQYVVEKKSFNISREPLVSLEHPLFRDANEALRTFFDLEVTESHFEFSNKGHLLVLIPDYRARLSELKIKYTKVSAIIETEYLDKKDLRVRVFAKSGADSFISPLLELEDHQVEFDCKHDINYALIYLLSTSGEAIDFKEWSLRWNHRRDKTVTVERPEEQIKDIIRQGEGPNLEFKHNIDNKTDFLETIVAFSNSSGGIIIVGIDNNGQVKGFKGNKEDILKMIHDSCEPPITSKFKSYNNIDGYPIMILEIESGENKPYLLKSNGIAYVRHGSNDFPPSRAEFDQMYQRNSVGY